MPSKEGEIVAKEGQTTKNLQLHPSVIIHISDHWTRAKVQQEINNPRVVGALWGIQNGRNIEILNAFELVFSEKEGINAEYLHNKQQQCKPVIIVVYFKILY
jgi:COP9 signalosome complex subunit 6